MRNYDLAPLYRATVGFDQIADPAISLCAAIPPAGAKFDLAMIDALARAAVKKAMRGSQHQIRRNQRTCAKATPVDIQTADSLPAAGLIACIQPCQTCILCRCAADAHGQAGTKQPDGKDQSAWHHIPSKVLVLR